MGAYVDVELFDRAAYKRQVAPALDEFFIMGKSHSIVELLKAVAGKPDASSDLKREIQESLGILDGTIIYSPSTNHKGTATTPADRELFVRLSIVGLLVREICVLDKQMVSKSKLPGFLYARSDWIERYLTFAASPSGGPIQYPSGEGGTEIFSLLEVTRFVSELKNMPPAPKEIWAELAHLRHVVEAADYGVERVITRSLS